MKCKNKLEKKRGNLLAENWLTDDDDVDDDADGEDVEFGDSVFNLPFDDDEELIAESFSCDGKL